MCFDVVCVSIEMKWLRRWDFLIRYKEGTKDYHIPTRRSSSSLPALAAPTCNHMLPGMKSIKSTYHVIITRQSTIKQLSASTALPRECDLNSSLNQPALADTIQASTPFDWNSSAQSEKTLAQDRP